MIVYRKDTKQVVSISENDIEISCDNLGISKQNISEEEKLKVNADYHIYFDKKLIFEKSVLLEKKELKQKITEATTIDELKMIIQDII